VSFEAFMVGMFQVVFWVVTPCSVVGYQYFRGWRWRQHGPLKHWYPTTPQHGITIQRCLLELP